MTPGPPQINTELHSPRDRRMHDSGARQQFATGAQRDTAEGKPDFSFLGPWAWVHLPPYGAYIRDYLLTRDVRHMESLFDTLRMDVGWARLLEWLRIGAEKYERFNWAKGIPVSRSLASLGRHLHSMTQGMVDEDHGAAALCNVMFIVHVHRAVDAGFLPPELKDLFAFDRRPGVPCSCPPT